MIAAISIPGVFGICAKYIVANLPAPIKATLIDFFSASRLSDFSKSDINVLQLSYKSRFWSTF